MVAVVARVERVPDCSCFLVVVAGGGEVVLVVEEIDCCHQFPQRVAPGERGVVFSESVQLLPWLISFHLIYFCGERIVSLWVRRGWRSGEVLRQYIYCLYDRVKDMIFLNQNV